MGETKDKLTARMAKAYEALDQAQKSLDACCERVNGSEELKRYQDKRRAARLVIEQLKEELPDA